MGQLATSRRGFGQGKSTTVPNGASALEWPLAISPESLIVQ